jgi:hypothetical protein
MSDALEVLVGDINDVKAGPVLLPVIGRMAP